VQYGEIDSLCTAPSSHPESPHVTLDLTKFKNTSKGCPVFRAGRLQNESLLLTSEMNISAS